MHYQVFHCRTAFEQHANNLNFIICGCPRDNRISSDYVVDIQLELRGSI